MQIISELAQILALKYPEGATIGFVPTMGYLHAGHLSLVKACKAQCDLTIVSIYVNPSQFGPNEDLAKYPRDTQRDLQLLQELEVDYVFLPTNEMIYPEGYATWVEVSGLSEVLCGAKRPGHFKGVCTIVLKLVNIVRPYYMYMGEKDYQQLTILQTMLKDLNHFTRIIPCPLIREEDGLALSSRNVYLSASERENALSLSKSLFKARQMVEAGEKDPAIITQMAKELIEAGGLKPDYVEIRDSRDLSPVKEIDSFSRLFLAAFAGKTRLIDNSLLI